MDHYVTGAVIRSLREARGMTQQALAEQLYISAKTVSKWETGKGLPDISLIEPLAATLGASVIELMRGEPVTNRNRASNLMRSKWYVCPLCGNVLHAAGDAVISCCGVTLPPLEAEASDIDHALTVESVEDEHFLTITHPMEKEHSITFIAFVTGDRLQLVRLYPEGNAETRMNLRGMGTIYWYCNRHGLFCQKWRRPRPARV